MNKQASRDNGHDKIESLHVSDAKLFDPADIHKVRQSYNAHTSIYFPHEAVQVTVFKPKQASLWRKMKNFFHKDNKALNTTEKDHGRRSFCGKNLKDLFTSCFGHSKE